MASIAFPSLAKQAKLSDGTQYGYVYVPAQSGKQTLLLLHGFPSSSYDWRDQISDLPKLGYGVFVPDLLGYGDTDKPLELLALEGIDKVVSIGHDYGCVVLSHLIVHHRSPFQGIIFATVGFVDPGCKLDMDALKAINAETKQRLGESTSGYVELFLRDDAANVLEAAPLTVNSHLYPADPNVWRDVLGPPGAFEAALKAGKMVPIADYILPEEVEMHHKIMIQGGYNAPLNWFRRMVFLGPSKEDTTLTDNDKEFTLPSLYILCEKDWVTHEQWHLHETTRYAKNLELKRLQSAHWVMLEKRDEFNEILHAFISKL